MVWINSLAVLTVFTLGSCAPITKNSTQQDLNTPIVHIKNGSITGEFIQNFNQDAYLGIPFAEPPLKKLRFKPPQPYNQSWSEIKNFTQYGDACIASSGSSTLPQSEDCLTLNIVKPHGWENETLPVGIWIHGGSFTEGSGVSGAFNLSWIVQNSIDIGKPFIGVTINYRLNGFGFLSSDEVSRKGYTNIGLRDQIQAIEWIHENIAGFGGDPNHLVLWGESAGSISIGKLLSQDNYLDEEYIKGAIMESGPNVFPNIKPAATEQNQEDFLSVVKHVDCFDNVTDYLECLTTVDAKKLQNAFNVSNGVVDVGFNFPYIDGDVIPKSSYEVLKSGEGFLKVPILIGTSTDEGSAFVNRTLNSTEDVVKYLKFYLPNLNNQTIEDLISLYPANNSETIVPQDPTYNTSAITYPSSIVGKQYKTLASMYGDITFIAGTKITSRLYSEHKIPVYKYRFNIPALQIAFLPFLGVTHAQEIPYVFDNQKTSKTADDGTGFFPDPKASKIANTMSKAWVSFIHDLDPNISKDVKLQAELPEWPQYKVNSTTNSGENLVFDLNGIYVEDDVVRHKQIDYIESVISQLNT
ncbi:Liver carboxylesterase 4 [Wickerhamomyces ciferrii]|uniref:Carboxylic ester hydrolase n=1 Tax=Wickerhamomyces ciferrii (strain ATCC 14091 / BCRC 22168 / CBS 111 / JCM 3599 / NBRC 0793 / NRRL Y-1031 F-60-10) TaxID=1206466 RepID=K0KMK9_WICCF|nr:Liver carboxylesterase 4 [Wickerhamomyces ciferrii]CCH42343.1 Liver carboxylesterase 4 [Wickerhamomyces ciferrii]